MSINDSAAASSASCASLSRSTKYAAHAAHVGGRRAAQGLQPERRQHRVRAAAIVRARAALDESRLHQPVDPAGDAARREVQPAGELAHADRLRRAPPRGARAPRSRPGSGRARPELVVEHGQQPGRGLRRGPARPASPARRATRHLGLAHTRDPTRRPGMFLRLQAFGLSVAIATIALTRHPQESPNDHHRQSQAIRNAPAAGTYALDAEPLARVVQRPPPHGHQGPRPLPRHRRHARRSPRTRRSRRSRRRSTSRPSTAATRSATSTCARPTSSTPSSYPTVTFRSTEVDDHGDGEFTLDGDLTDPRTSTTPGHAEGRVPRHAGVAVGRHPRRLQRRDRGQPQGLGPRVERCARDRRRASSATRSSSPSTPSGSRSNGAIREERVGISSEISGALFRAPGAASGSGAGGAVEVVDGGLDVGPRRKQEAYRGSEPSMSS